MDGILEVTGIVAGPLTLALGFARFATSRLAAIGLRLGVTVVREEELFATPAQPFFDALHDPAPPGQSSNIKNIQGRKGLNAGRKQKNGGEFSDLEEKRETKKTHFQSAAMAALSGRPWHRKPQQ